jgi:hypothetical protein
MQSKLKHNGNAEETGSAAGSYTGSVTFKNRRKVRRPDNLFNIFLVNNAIFSCICERKSDENSREK